MSCAVVSYELEVPEAEPMSVIGGDCASRAYTDRMLRLCSSYA